MADSTPDSDSTDETFDHEGAAEAFQAAMQGTDPKSPVVAFLQSMQNDGDDEPDAPRTPLQRRLNALEGDLLVLAQECCALSFQSDPELDEDEGIARPERHLSLHWLVGRLRVATREAQRLIRDY